MASIHPFRRRHSRGQAMVESALVLLALLMMTLFIIDMSRVLFLQQYILDRARDTARMAAVNSWGENRVRNYFCYNNPQKHEYWDSVWFADRLTPGGLMGIRPWQVNYAVLGTPNTPTYRVQVRVSNVPGFLMVPFLTGSNYLPPVTLEFPAQSMGATD